MKRGTTSERGMAKRGATSAMTAALLLAGLLVTGARAEPVPMSFGAPLVIGAGVGQTARYSNVATQAGGGDSIDMLATITAQNTSDVHDFLAVGGHHKISLQGSGDRTVTIRYDFFESGTSNPVAIEEILWAVGDLDGVTGKTERIEVAGTAGHAVTNPTNLSVEDTGSLLRFTGTQDESSSPESAVALSFVNQPSFTVTYVVLAGGAVDGGFLHEGSGDFTFGVPEQSEEAVNLYYTFTLTNQEEMQVKMDFTDVLPGSLKWDTGYEVVTSGSFAVTQEMLSFSEADQRVDLLEFMLPPGVSTFTLRTLPPEEGGTVHNEAMAKPTGDSGFPELPINSSLAVVVPDPPPPPLPPWGDDDDD